MANSFVFGILAGLVPGGTIAICVVTGLLIVTAGVLLYLALRNKKGAQQPAPAAKSAPQPKPQPKPEPKPQPKPEPKPQPKPEPKPQPKPEPKPQPKPEPKPEPKPVVVPAPKPKPKKEDIHIETRQRVKAAEVDTILEDEIAATMVEESTRIADRTKTGIINVDILEQYFNDGETVTLDEIKKRIQGYKKVTYIKVLARGTLDKKLTVEADDYSIEAVKMILLTGGKVIRTRSK